jgi:hypothetical protein
MKTFIAAVLLSVSFFLNATVLAGQTQTADKPVLPSMPKEISALIEEMMSAKLFDEQFAPIGPIPASKLYAFWKTGDITKIAVVRVVVATTHDGGYEFPSEFNQYSVVFVKVMTFDSGGKIGQLEWLNEQLLIMYYEEALKKHIPKKGVDFNI